MIAIILLYEPDFDLFTRVGRLNCYTGYSLDYVQQFCIEHRRRKRRKIVVQEKSKQDRKVVANRHEPNYLRC